MSEQILSPYKTEVKELERLFGLYSVDTLESEVIFSKRKIIVF